MPTLEEVQKQVNETADAIESKLETMESEQKELGETTEETKNALEELIDDFKEQQEQLDQLQRKHKKLRKGQTEEGTRWEKDFGESLESSEAFQALQKGRSRSAKMEVSPLTAKATMTTGNTLTGEVIEPDRVPGVVTPPERPTHIRQFIASGQTTSDTIRYIEETGFTNNAATVAENSDKPESEIDLEAKDAPVRTIAHTARLSKRMLDDIPFLRSYLGNRLTYGIRKEEDEQILYGDGTGENLTGITIDNLSDFDNSDLTSNVSKINRYDAIRFAILQAREAEYQPDAVMLSPLDVAIMETAKDDNGQYLDLIDRLGVTVVENTAINDNEFIVGSFSTGGIVQLFDREQTAVEFFDQDRDNVVKNLMTVRVEERLALPIYRPEGIVFGDFSTDLSGS